MTARTPAKPASAPNGNGRIHESDVDELRTLAAEAGLEDIEPTLTDERLDTRVQASTQQAQQLGINGIPAFLPDSTLLVLGAQPLGVFQQAFDTLAA